MKAIVVGAGGQLGRALGAVLPDAVMSYRADLDVTDRDAVATADWSGANVLINAAAYTAVDRAETPEGRAAAWQTNAVGVANLTAATNAHSLILVHLSSEYVFDGTSEGPITEDAPHTPLSAYGASKAAGDVAASLADRHYIVRTSWVIGDGGNFVRTMLRLAACGARPTVVTDQVGRPTFADDLAAGIAALVHAEAPFGTYNLTNRGEPASWADVARAVFALAGHSPSCVTDTTTAAYFADRPNSARRPLNSVLDLRKSKAVGVLLPPWQESLDDYVDREMSHE